ncbi:MAG: hypothetical protein AAB432_01260 [Patescibacteria group bacterium]
MNRRAFLATGLLAGTIIGAGIFSLPYIFKEVGLATGFFYLIFFTAVYWIIHWMYAKILEIQPEEHQFFNLSKKYFAPFFANFASFLILFELIFVLVVYLILSPVFAQIAFGRSMTTLVPVLFFWLISSIFAFANLKWFGIAEFFGTIVILVIVGLTFFLGSSSPLEINFFNKMDFGIFFLPFGPLLFSLSGRPALHKVVEAWRKSGKSFSLNKVVGWGTVIPAVVYFIFVVGILRLNPNIAPEALNSLSFLPPFFLSVFGWLGLITLWTSYFVIAANVKDIFALDLKYPRWGAALLSLFAPLILYFLVSKEFLPVLSFTGGVFLAIESIFVVMIWHKAFPNHPYRAFTLLLYAVFVLALGYEIFKFVF